MKKIMVVDDDPGIRELIRLYFEVDGYEVISYSTGEDALANYLYDLPDAIIQDIMLPGIDGNEVVRSIRTYSSVPIIMLTAKSGSETMIAGLQNGADDYLEKPFDPKVLVARVEAVIRRAEGKLEMANNGKKITGKSYVHLKPEDMPEDPNNPGGEGSPSPDPVGETPISQETSSAQTPIAQTDSAMVKIDNLVVDKNSYLAYLDDVPIKLSPKELELLYFLACHPNKVFSRKELMNKLWHNGPQGSSRTIDVHIKRIREKFPDEAHPAWSVDTVWGRGYIFKC